MHVANVVASLPYGALQPPVVSEHSTITASSSTGNDTNGTGSSNADQMNQATNLAVSSTAQGNGFSFTPPTVPLVKDGKYSGDKRLLQFLTFCLSVYEIYRQCWVKFLNVQRNVELIATEQRLELRGAVQASETGERGSIQSYTNTYSIIQLHETCKRYVCWRCNRGSTILLINVHRKSN